MISAMMLTAISSGDRAPMFSPTGPWMRPVLALTVLLCLFLAGGILFFRR